MERAEERLANYPEAMRIRRATVEYPFGTLKHWMGSEHFRTKQLENVRTENGPSRAGIQHETCTEPHRGKAVDRSDLTSSFVSGKVQ